MADIHATAVQAEKFAEQLATELAQEGASEQTVQTVTQCAEVFRQMVEALGRGQEETGDKEPSSLDQAAGETQEAMQASAAKQNA
jgi:hypothetical protein